MYHWLFFTSWIQTLWAAQVGVRVSSREIFVDVPFEFSIIAEDFEESPTPDVEDFTFPNCDVQFVGAFPSSSRQITIINGVRSQQIDIKTEYKYIVKAKQPGLITIPPIRVTQGSTTATSKQSQLQVRDISTTDSLYISLVLPSQAVRVGQTSEIFIDIYTNKDLNEFQLSIPFLEMSEFISIEKEEIPRQQRSFAVSIAGVPIEFPYSVSEELYKRKKYTRYRIKAKVQYIKSGNIEIEPSQLVAEVAVGQNRNRFGFYSTTYNRYKAVDSPKTLNIQSLPLKGRPKSFKGAIGSSYALEVRVGKSIIEVGEPVELEIFVRGKGNFDGLQLADLDIMGLDPDQFDVPEHILIGELQDDGSKKFMPSIQVKHAQVREIPRLEFSYFDPDKESYEKVYSDPIALSVKDQESIGSQNVIRSNISNNSQRNGSISPNLSTNSSSSLYLTGADLTLSSQDQTFRKSIVLENIQWLLLLCYTVPIALFGWFQYRSNTSDTREEKYRKQQTFKNVLSAIEAAQNIPAKQSVSKLTAALQEWGKESNIEIAHLVTKLEIEAYAPTASTQSVSASILQEIKDLIHETPKSNSTIALLLLIGILSGVPSNSLANTPDIDTLRMEYQNALSTLDRNERVQKFQFVMKGFESLSAQNPLAPELYVDLGNAALGASEIGIARYAFETATHLTPRSSRAKQNISWIESQLPEWTRSKASISTLDRFLFWSSFLNGAEQMMLGSLFFALALLLRLDVSKKFHPISFAFLFLWLTVLMSSIWDYQSNPVAVVQSQAGPLRSADNQGAPAITTEWLPEGCIVKIVQQNEDWSEVSLFSGTRGWIPNHGLRVIEKQ